MRIGLRKKAVIIIIILLKVTKLPEKRDYYEVLGVDKTARCRRG